MNMSMGQIQTSAGGMPVVILREGTRENKGREAQKNNLTAAKLVAEVVKSSLGPRGMDKMLVDSLGDVTITNDGATILKEIDVQHPAAKMVVEVAKSVDNEVGDGTTSSVIFTGSLLEKAEELIDKNVHPSVIVDGYTAASIEALQTLDKIAIKVKTDDRDLLAKIANTSMYSKLVSEDSPVLSKIVVDATQMIAELNEKTKTLKVDLDNIKIEKNEMSAEIRISDPQQMQMFLEEENNMLRAMVEKVKSSGANVLLCQKGIDDLAQHYLAKDGILAVRRVKESDMLKLTKATGARLVNNIDDLSSKDLGSADVVEERKVETDKWVFIEGCKNPKAVTILVRGGSQRVVDEADRSLHDALMVMKDVLEKPFIVAGGGAPEAYIATHIRNWSSGLEGREQLAVIKFAEALETIPISLATNAGMDPIDTMAELRAKQNKGMKWTGVNVRSTTVSDMFKQNILEPVVIKEQIIKSATEAACMLLRIDDVIASSKSKAPPGGGMPGGMGGMGELLIYLMQ